MSSPPVLVGSCDILFFQFIIYTCIICIARVSLRHRKSYSCWTICLYLSEEHHRTLVWRYVYPHIYASRYHCLRVCISLREKQSKKYMVWSWFDYAVIYLQKTLIALSLFTSKCISYTHVYLRIYVHAYQSQTHLDLFWFTVGIPSSDIENVIFAPFWVIVKQETKRNTQKQIETKRDTTETKRSEKRHNRNETKPKKISNPEIASGELKNLWNLLEYLFGYGRKNNQDFISKSSPPFLLLVCCVIFWDS